MTLVKHYSSVLYGFAFLKFHVNPVQIMNRIMLFTKKNGKRNTGLNVEGIA